MNPLSQRTFAWLCVTSCAWAGGAFNVRAESRESRRVPPVFQNSIVEKPVFARPGKAKPIVTPPPRIEFPPLEKPVQEKNSVERSKREMSVMESPKVMDVFHHPDERRPLEGFPHRNLRRIPKHTVPGSGASLQSYVRGTPLRIKEHNNSYGRYHFRNPNERKPDHER
jgi:hypothetical protein